MVPGRERSTPTSFRFQNQDQTPTATGPTFDADQDVSGSNRAVQ